MVRGEKVNQAYAAIHNRKLILQLIRNGPVSRRQLMALSGLRGSTVTCIVRDLLDCGVVVTAGKRKSSSVGKKQVLLEINPSLGWVVGCGISTDWTLLTYMDMAGNVLDEDCFSTRNDLGKILDSVGQRVTAWSASHKDDVGKMLGIGVGVPGVVNVDSGRIKLSSMLKVQKYAFRDILSEQFNTIVHVDNNVNLAAQAESRVGAAAEIDNFIYFHLSVSLEEDNTYGFNSIGSTHCLDGKPYRGAHYSAGEIDRLLQDTVPISEVSANELLLMGEAKGEMTDGMKLFAVGTGQTLATICDLFDPQTVIISSNTPFCNAKLFEVIQDELNKHLVPVPDRYIPVFPSGLGDHSVARGAAITVLDRAVSDVEQGVLSKLKSGA